MAREFFPGVGQAVAARTILRDNETWADVARRVALGNTLLHHSGEADREAFESAIADGQILMSGRHLQHGDEDQPNRNLEVFSNCSTASQRTTLFYLLLNGSGVGTCYDDDMCIVDWSRMPITIPVLAKDHADNNGEFLTLSEAINEASFFGCDYDVFTVPDSREGWAEAVQEIETAAFNSHRRGRYLILDFSLVRPYGAPIGGMQSRPSSGPIPLMEAIVKINAMRDERLPLWLQALTIDHLLAEIVLVGGARRAARIAVKWWEDTDIIEFINIKQRAGLWSANNSVGVDARFWSLVAFVKRHQYFLTGDHKRAWDVFKAVVEAQYDHGTGEPGFLNLDLISKGEDEDAAEELGGRLTLNSGSLMLRSALGECASRKKYTVIVNPCVPGDTPILTDKGYFPIVDLVGKQVNVWNGMKFSPVTPFATGHNPTVIVSLSDGTSLRCTPAHKFVVRGDERVEAAHLVEGMQLEKYDMPFVEEGTVDVDHDAYSQGFYSGDGCKGLSHSWLYEPKYECASRLIGTFSEPNAHKRRTWKHGPMLDKTWVPVEASGFYCLNWLAGLIDSDGTVCTDREGGQSLQISSVDKEFLMRVRLMLTRLGVQAKVALSHAGQTKEMPGGSYDCQPCWRLVICGFDAYRLHASGLVLTRAKFNPPVPQRSARRFVTVVSVEDSDSCDTYCFTEEDNHTGTFNGIVTGQCGEIRLALMGAYCVIADIAASFCDDLVEVSRLTTRALIRTNLMPSLYEGEVYRTNRIGVSLTGIHEFAWLKYGLTFHDLIADGEGTVIDANGVEMPAPKHLKFWNHVMAAAIAVDEECDTYSKLLGVQIPRTRRTMKPAGTTSKLFGLTEAAHLPAMREYLRWVQFRDDSPLVAEYEAKGYPIRRNLQSYKGVVIVGFPTRLLISELMGPNVVTAAEATPEQQIRWLRLLETYWLLEEGGNQISYTLKYDPKVVSKDQYENFILENVPLVRAISIMPQIDATAYEYQPEEPLTPEQFEALMANIDRHAQEDIGAEHLSCATGACPVDFSTATAA